MNAFKFFLPLALFLILTGSVYAQYWFQFGARSGNGASFNNGARVTIQTITPQNLTKGSLGFWVGEILSNGAFIQAGYVIENATGNYPGLCTENGCTDYETLKAGDAEWFYEYFPPNYNGGFLGAIGADGSAGANGTFHTYGFYSIGNTWYFTFDGKVVGSVDLGTDNSGANVPVAFGELANTSTTNTYIKDVVFENLSAYKYGLWLPVQSGLAYIGYGVGSEKNLRNPYGVKELDNRVNYFAVGSGLPQPENGTQLWSLGYYLTINSKYGNLSSKTGYIAYSTAQLSAPRYVYIAPGVRAEFSGWIGSGLGSYTGPLNSTTINIDSNITENATWSIEYLFNPTTEYGKATGGGWYKNNTLVSYSINTTTIYLNKTTRLEFLGWSNGVKNTAGRIIINRPINISALWSKEYLVSAETPYGNATGSGWWPEGTIITLQIPKTIVNQTSDEKVAFYSWSNGNTSPSLKLVVDRPINISGIFRNEYLVKLVGENAYSQPVNISLFYVDEAPSNGSLFLFANTTHRINYAVYKGVKIYSGMEINVSGPETIDVPLAIYNVSITTKDIFGLPVNAYAELTFSNGSTTTSNINGTLTIRNVPYGYVNGKITYLGISQHILLTNGRGANLIFFSIADIISIAVVVIAIALSYYISKKKFGGKDRQEVVGEGQNVENA